MILSSSVYRIINIGLLLTFCFIFTLTSDLEAVDLSRLDRSQKLVYSKVIDEINSPFCPGRLLRDCPSSGADKLKNEIFNLAKQDKSSGEIKEKLFKIYGEDINPLPSGKVGYLAWGIPSILFGFTFLVIIFRTYQSKRPN